jgi:hypothetical protein
MHPAVMARKGFELFFVAIALVPITAMREGVERVEVDDEQQQQTTTTRCAPSQRRVLCREKSVKSHWR